MPAYIGYTETSSAGYTLGDLIFGTRPGTTDVVPSERMRITASGDVGIGTTAPLAKLDIKGSTDTWAGMAKIFLTDSNSNVDSRNWMIGNGGSAYGSLTFGVSTTKDGDPSASGNLAMVINKSGYVGIGATNPSSLLTIQTPPGSGGTFEMKKTSGYTTVKIGDGGSVSSTGIIQYLKLEWKLSDFIQEIHL